MARLALAVCVLAAVAARPAHITQMSLEKIADRLGFVYAASSEAWSGYDEYNQREKGTAYARFFQTNKTNYLESAVWSASRLGARAPVTIFTDDVAKCQGDVAALSPARPRMKCATVPGDQGGKGFRFAKIGAMIHSPYEKTMFIDSDTAPCEEAQVFAPFILRQLEHADVLAVTFPGAPIYGHFNSGIMAFNTRKASVQEWLKSWQTTWVGSFRTDGGNAYGDKLRATLDQSTLTQTLLAATVRAFPLPEKFNGKMVSGGIGLGCCNGASHKFVVIDHACRPGLYGEQEEKTKPPRTEALTAAEHYAFGSAVRCNTGSTVRYVDSGRCRG